MRRTTHGTSLPQRTERCPARPGPAVSGPARLSFLLDMLDITDIVNRSLGAQIAGQI
ncbi:hypothetical protein R8Z50_04690 [Longispora sp. K20-0274]|uniref:hypothetical protein n=1 Tax=Longispora sp. K20-0274 TaxID=3088255 RepID=UPI00399B5553